MNGDILQNSAGRELLQVGSYTIIGDRTSQQDALRCARRDNVLFAAVCDGMGGMAGGERASAEAIGRMFQVFQAEPLPAEAACPEWLRDRFQEADQAVSSLADENGNYMGAGTTVVAALLWDNRLYWGSVGDSMIYYLRKGEGLRRVTRMHNYNLRLEELLMNGEITREQMAQEAARGEALISFLGIGGLPLMDISKGAYKMESGDILLMSSDGLYKSLDDQQVQAIVEESGENMQLAAQRLCNEAWRLSVSKQDNTTVIAIRCS